MGDEDEDVEEVVLTRWERIKQWIEIVVATKKVAMLVWSLIFGVGGTALVGTVTETNPLRDVAIEMGIVEADPIDTTKGMLQEELMSQFADMRQDIIDLQTHQHNYPSPQLIPHEHPAQKHDHSLKEHGHPVPTHDHPYQAHEHEFPEVKELRALIPDDHLRLH